MTKGGKGSGFSGGMTVADKAKAYAESKISAGDYYGNPLDVDNLPSFVTDKLSQGEYYAASVGDASIKRETEKAVLISYATDYGEVTLWAPKSVIKTEADMKESARRTHERQYLNDSYNDYLRTTAKAAGVKLGSTRKWAKVQDKLTKAGVKWLSRDDYANTKA